ncbi:hypothetical protein DRJ16_00275 [Candidatus Woesearchaeota archaeon]|nr:MAG: hypothetical protein DRJ16_00275 [Candidatus Woesearchaeota archaeon]
MANNSLSKFNKFTKFTKYQFDIESSLWHTFKLIAYSQGLKVKEAIRQAIIEYIQNHKTQHQNITVKIIKNIEAKQNLLQFIIEEETKTLLKSLIDAQKRGASWQHINQLKLKVIDNIKKNPNISEDLANQIKIVFQNLARRETT